MGFQMGLFDRFKKEQKEEKPKKSGGHGSHWDMISESESELPSLISMHIGSDPFKEDSDGDGLTDKYELLGLGLLTNVSSAITNGTYTEYLAKGDTVGDIVTDLAHINKGGIDYAAKEGNVLKIVEAKARASLSRADIKNYIKTDKSGAVKEFNVDYAVKELGEKYFTNPVPRTPLASASG